ncbi:MAG: sigma-70 family RNA polymerase sigma factor [Defluviitaleaceae bacterium]|nr:sigma-70 family RNA polymerase sigma factor [Defluviitaleaceae bacterium]
MPSSDTAVRFDEIYDATNKAVLAFITAKCGRTADIGDIFQETYTELYDLMRRRGTDYVTHEMALVLRIARRKVARYYSLAQRLSVFVSSISVNENGDEVDLTALETDSFLTEDFVVNHSLLGAARQYINSKPEDVQKVFYLMYDVGLTIPEIARTLNISESGVKNKLYRTLKELRKILS